MMRKRKDVQHTIMILMFYKNAKSRLIIHVSMNNVVCLQFIDLGVDFRAYFHTLAASVNV